MAMAAMLQGAGGAPPPGGPPMGAPPMMPPPGPPPPPPGPMGVPPPAPPPAMAGMPGGPPQPSGDMGLDLVMQASYLLDLAVRFMDPSSEESDVIAGVQRDLSAYIAHRQGAPGPMGPRRPLSGGNSRSGGPHNLHRNSNGPRPVRGTENLPDVPPPPGPTDLY